MTLIVFTISMTLFSMNALAYTRTKISHVEVTSDLESVAVLYGTPKTLEFNVGDADYIYFNQSYDTCWERYDV